MSEFLCITLLFDFCFHMRQCQHSKAGSSLLHIQTFKISLDKHNILHRLDTRNNSLRVKVVVTHSWPVVISPVVSGAANRL